MPYDEISGDEEIGSLASDVARASRELGISGYDNVGDEEVSGDVGDYDEVGARRPKSRRSQMIGVPWRGNRGPLRVLTLPCTAPLTLAAAALGNLVFTPNRNCVIIDLIIDCYVAAAAAAARMPAALAITNATVQGRLVNAGTGQMPITAFMPQYGWRHKPFIEWGNCDASQSIVLSLVNNDAATTHIVTAVIFAVTVP
jgi:hypothetical protein